MSEPAGSDRNCQGVRRDGQPCRAPALTPGGRCWAHSEELASKRSEARRRGGHNSSKLARLHRELSPRLQPVAELLERALNEIHGGSLTPARGQALAQLARALVFVLESGELAERVRMLEERLQTEQGDHRWA